MNCRNVRFCFVVYPRTPRVCVLGVRGWGPISGICEPGEEITATALREVKEEIGLDGRIEALLGVGQVAAAARRPARRAPQDPPPVTPQVSRGSAAASWAPLCRRAAARMTRSSARKAATSAVEREGNIHALLGDAPLVNPGVIGFNVRGR